MEVIKTFWQNLTRPQKIGLVCLVQATIALVFLLLVMSAFREQNHSVNIENEEVLNEVPEKNRKLFMDRLWDVVSTQFVNLDTSIINDAVVREGTFKNEKTDVGYEASFIVDIDSIKQSYRGYISWVTKSDSGLYDDIVIDCPPRSEMKYPESFCQTAYNNTNSLELYLPYVVTTDLEEEAEDIYITGNKYDHTIDVQIVACGDNQARLKEQADEYLKSIPTDLSSYTINYDVTSVDANCQGYTDGQQ